MNSQASAIYAIDEARIEPCRVSLMSEHNLFLNIIRM